MTYDELIAAASAELRSAIAERDAKQEVLMKMRSDVAEGKEIPAEDIPAAIAARDAANATVEQHKDALATLEAERAEDARIAELREQTVSVEQPKRAYDQVARVGREERTYRQDQDPEGTVFLRDFISGAVFGDYSAQQRLGRHMDEERVERAEYMERANTPSANFGSLVVPAYLTDLYAPKARASRPFADAMRKHPLPATGNTIELAKITTGTTTAVRTDETSAVSETNIDDTSFSVNVLEVAGAQSLSRKSVMRGTGIDNVVWEDLFSAYNTTVDSTVINQATTGLDAVATQVAYTDSSPTAAELYPKLLAAGAAVEAALLDQDPNGTAFVMHSRRWAWIQSQLSSTFPLIAQPVNAGLNVAGVANNSGYGSSVRGILPNGAPVIVDNNIATNVDVGGATTHDKIFVVSLPECHLWEDPNAPMYIRTDTGPSMKSNGIDIVVFGFMAYTFLRQAHAQAIFGTGTVAPTF